MARSQANTMLGWSVSCPIRLASTWSMVMPPWMIEPLRIGTPDNMLPVIAG